MSLFGGGRREPRERTEEERRQALIERERRRSGDPNWTPPSGHPLAPRAAAAPVRPDSAADSAVRAGAPAAPAQPAREARPAAPVQPAAAQPAPARPAPVQPAAGRPAPAQTPPATPAPAPVDAAGDSWWDDGDLHEQPFASSTEPVTAWPPPIPADAPLPKFAPAKPAQPAEAAPRAATSSAPLDAPAEARRPAGRAPAREPGRAPAREPGRPANREQGTRRIEPDPPGQPVAPAYDLPDHREIAVHRRRSLAGRTATRTVVSPPGDANMGGTLGGHRSRGRRIAGLIGIVLVLLFMWSQWKLWQPGKGGGTTEVMVTIPSGASASDVSKKLEEAGVIDSARLFGLRALLAGKREDLKAGNLQLKHDMSYGAALAALSGTTAAVADTTSVTIPEGLSIRETAKRLANPPDRVQDYGATAYAMFKPRKPSLVKLYKMPSSSKSLEGFLFPSTYELPTGFRASELIDRQLQAFDQQFSTISMTHAKKANLTPYDVIIIASLIEREAGLTRERPLISAVIYNRLKAGMPLGIDAAYRYKSGDWINPIKQSQIDAPGPYNLRLKTGLPPSPIGNPGLAALEAAAKPANVDYLYFVVKPGRCNEHAFSSTAEKFAQDSAKYNAARNAAGKSPATC